MDHLVGQDPVRGKLRRKSVVADTYGDPSASIAKRHPVADAFSFECSDPNRDLRQRKAAIIGSHRLGGRLHPKKYILRRHWQSAPFNRDVYPSVSDQQTRSHPTPRYRKGRTNQKK